MILYHILTLQVNAPNAVVKLDKQLPSHFDVCTGYVARVCKGITSPNDIAEIGMISLEFNNRAIHAVNSIVDFEARAEKKTEYQQLSVPLKANTLFSGVYHDWRNPQLVPFTPYEVKIYLRCESKAKRNV